MKILGKKIMDIVKLLETFKNIILQPKHWKNYMYRVNAPIVQHACYNCIATPNKLLEVHLETRSFHSLL